MWALALGLSGIGLATSLVAATETLSSMKYVCAVSTDDMVEALQVIDGVRALSGLIVCAVCAWGYLSKQMTRQRLQLFHGNVLAVLVINLAVLFLGVVQKSDACSNCIKKDSTTFQADLQKMLGGTDCASRLSEGLFKVPDNYCNDALQALQCQVTTQSYAERCLVYSCTGYVPGYEFRYLYGVFGLTCQIVACLILIIADGMIQVVTDVEAQDSQNGPAFASDGSTFNSTAAQGVYMPLPTELRKRSSNLTGEVAEEIHF